MIIEFEIPVAPVAKQRARTFFNKRINRMSTWTPSETTSFEESVRFYALKYRPETPIECPLKLTADFYIPGPKKRKHLRPVTRPDLDNYLKSVMDGLNKIIWKDDSCICEISANKFYATDYPKLVVRIEQIK